MPPTDPDTDPLELQQLLVETTLPLVFETYDNAVEEEVVDPIVLVVDCEDALGGQIARGWLGDEAIDDAIAAESGEDDSEHLTTALARAIAWADAAGALSEAFPYLASVFDDRPPEDGVLVIGVAAGGASALTAPWDARE